MLPTWAPNIHPLIVHFPIVLLLVAALTDVVRTVLRRPVWLDAAVPSLYVAGAIAAALTYWSGTIAASTVHTAGMAHPMVEEHRAWGLATMLTAVLLAAAHIGARWTAIGRTRPGRVALAVAGLVLAGVVYETAEHGARLVYEFGVGVIALPGLR